MTRVWAGISPVNTKGTGDGTMTGDLLHNLDLLARAGPVAGLTDAQLLERYTGRRGESAEIAFAAIVARHGPMVLGVCRHFLGDANDAHDAFQATFLVLVRRARSVRFDDSLGPWLYGVSCRVAARARSDSARRRAREAGGVDTLAAPPDRDADRNDVQAVLHAELNRLPEKYRVPVVLCHLEGMTHEEAARTLRCPVGTVSGRLSRARSLLRSRLTRRGMGATASAAVGAVLPRPADASVPPAFFKPTLQAAARLAAGQPVATPVWKLTQGVLIAMFLNKLKVVTGVACFGGLLALGAGYVAGQGPGPENSVAPTPKAANPPEPTPLRDGWKKVVPIADEVFGKNDRYITWVEGGWLQVRRETAAGVTDWWIVLARAIDLEPPLVAAHKGTGRFEVSYRGGRYFLREDAGSLKCLRERKPDGKDWSAVVTGLGPDVKWGWAGNDEAPPVVRGGRDQGWYWVVSGPTQDRSDCLLRLCPLDPEVKAGKKSGSGFVSMRFLKRAFYNEFSVEDDGELLVAQRKLEASIGTELAIGEQVPALKGKTLDGKPFDLKDYRGKFILLDFWATWWALSQSGPIRARPG